MGEVILVPPVATPQRVVLGVVLVMMVGLLVVAAAAAASGRPPWRRSSAVRHLALAWAAGPGVVVPVVLVAALGGLPLRGRPLMLALTLIAAAAAASVVVLRRTVAPAVRPGAAGSHAVAAPGGWPPAMLTGAGRIVLAATLVLALYKVAVVRLWSWDHFAIWGAKARLFTAGGRLDAGLLGHLELVSTTPQYPLGVPLIWPVVTLGGLPGDVVVRLVHAGWLLALVALVHGAARRLSGDDLVALAAAAFVAASPLAWDSIHLGLADLPLAFYTVAAVSAVLAAPGTTDRADAGEWSLAGLFVGFLPWVKNDGAPLAVILGTALVVWRWRGGRDGLRRDVAAFAVPAVGLGAAAAAVGRFLLPPGVGFLDGHLTARLGHRLLNPTEVLGPVANELMQPEWLGVWIALAVVLGVAIVRRRSAAVMLAGVAALQLGLYVGIFFASYIDSADHVATALPRIAGALVPLVALAAAALASPGPSGATFARRIRP